MKENGEKIDSNSFIIYQICKNKNFKDFKKMLAHEN